jgi:hypothetical protein
MKSIRLYIIFVFSFSFHNVFGQSILQLRFEPTLQGKVIKANQYFAFNTDSLLIEELRYYVGQFRIQTKDSQVHRLSDSYTLLSLEKNQLIIPYKPIENLKYIIFDLGIDSTVLERNSLQDDLDPIHGMYWSWQSGYIHVKLEGLYKKNGQMPIPFQFHLGGAYAPFNTIQMIERGLVQTDTICFEVPLDDFFSEALKNQPYQVMSPKPAAIRLSKILGDGITIK